MQNVPGAELIGPRLQCRPFYFSELVNGDEVDSIIKCAKKYRADLLIMGMRQHTWLIGHTAKDVAERSPCTLMGVPVDKTHRN
jgi:nucleotide-binding universal stress UspA family protein